MRQWQTVKDANARVTGSVLGVFELPLLISIAKIMPRWIKPDMLTALGVAGAVLAFVAYGLSVRSAQFLWVADFGIFVNWLGDSLDGTLARVRRIERPVYGFFVDHVCDIGSQILMGLGVGISPFVRLDVAAIALIVFLAFSILSYLKTSVAHELRISYLGVGPTEVRCGIIALNALFMWQGSAKRIFVFGVPMSSIDLAILCVCGVASVALVFLAMKDIKRVAQQDKAPIQEP